MLSNNAITISGHIIYLTIKLQIFIVNLAWLVDGLKLSRTGHKELQWPCNELMSIQVAPILGINLGGQNLPEDGYRHISNNKNSSS